jgi:hypothetical protein
MLLQQYNLSKKYLTRSEGTTELTDPQSGTDGQLFHVTAKARSAGQLMLLSVPETTGGVQAQ